MNGANKILTVSYGTFSCTLEGFDDPFNTMKAIAEYFRDLAADDRYFGAEPPTPDAAMLHKIAEREVNRRVEAKIADHGVTLRVEDEAPVAEAPMPRITMPAAQPAPAPMPTLAPEAASGLESAAARLSRLRAAQSQLAAPAPAPVHVTGDITSRFADVTSYAEDQDADTEFKPAPMVVTVPAASMALMPEPEAIPADIPDIEPEAAAKDDAILASLLNATPEAATVETEAEPEAEPVPSSLRETLSGLMTQDDATEAKAPADLSAFPDAEDDIDLADAAALDEPADNMDLSDLDDLAALDAPADTDSDDAEIVIPDAEPEPLAAKEPQVEASPEAPIITEKLQRARARVIKIRRLDKAAAPPLSAEAEADLQNTLAALEAEIVAPKTDAPAAETPAKEAPSVEATAVETLTGKALIEDAIVVAPASAPATERPATLIPANEADLDRLLAQTNTELDIPEVKRRRSAIAHLKAAVLATVAERKNNPRAMARVAEVRMDPYRQDLDKAVRPTGATGGDRPAPLVLVSAQRIDRKRDAAADANRPMPQIVATSPAPLPPTQTAPVRPRRVATRLLGGALPLEHSDEDNAPAAPLVVEPGKQSFAEFAESVGAVSMAELIEAAGAYCTLVLERPNFTRPQLFQQIATVPEMAEADREDGLRGFGKLLRDGRIQKTVRGQFALSDTSPILSEAKRIAG